MKINFIIPFTNPTGGIRVVFEYAKRLTELGHDVVCYTPIVAYKFNSNNPLRRIKATASNILLKKKNIKYINVSDTKIKMVPFINDSFIRNADVLIATAWPTAYSVEKLDSKKGRKYYFIQHYEDWSGPIDLVDGSYKLDLIQIVIAKWLKELMENKFYKTNVYIVNNGNDIVSEKQTKDINKPKKVLMMYHSLEWKGFNNGLKAFQNAKEIYNDVELILFGSEKLDNLPINAKYYFNPSRQKLRQLYEESDIYIFPSKIEGWGLTPIEAMACRCAVVGTNVGCMLDIGIHLKTALISEPDDIENMTQNILKLLEDENLLKCVQENGYQVAKELTWENATIHLEKIFTVNK